jgi:hypothetical protein
LSWRERPLQVREQGLLSRGPRPDERNVGDPGLHQLRIIEWPVDVRVEPVRQIRDVRHAELLPEIVDPEPLRVKDVVAQAEDVRIEAPVRTNGVVRIHVGDPDTLPAQPLQCRRRDERALVQDDHVRPESHGRREDGLIERGALPCGGEPAEDAGHTRGRLLPPRGTVWHDLGGVTAIAKSACESQAIAAMFESAHEEYTQLRFGRSVRHAGWDERLAVGFRRP